MPRNGAISSLASRVSVVSSWTSRCEPNYIHIMSCFICDYEKAAPPLLWWYDYSSISQANTIRKVRKKKNNKQGFFSKTSFFHNLKIKDQNKAGFAHRQNWPGCNREDMKALSKASPPAMAQLSAPEAWAACLLSALTLNMGCLIT